MVESVKKEVEVSREYMKIFEREQMLREEGREEGQKMAEKKIAELEQTIRELTNQIADLAKVSEK